MQMRKGKGQNPGSKERTREKPRAGPLSDDDISIIGYATRHV